MRYSIPSLDRGLRILDALAAERDGLGVSELSRRLVQDKSVVYRTLSSLVYQMYVEQDETTRKYLLTAKVIMLANAKLRGSDLFVVSQPFLRPLASRAGESVVVAALLGNAIVCLEREPGSRANHIVYEAGQFLPLHASACGKCVAAYLSESKVFSIVEKKGLVSITQNTITSFSELRINLEEVRRKGYAVDDEETCVGVRSIAAPVWDQKGSIVGSLAVWGPVERIREDCTSVLVDMVKDAALTLSSRLGYRATASKLFKQRRT